MSRLSRRRFLQMGGASVAGAVLAACSTSGDDTTPDSTAPSNPAGGSGAPADAFPRTVKHAFGSTTIEEVPRRIVTIGWANAEVVAAFDIIPAAMGPVMWGGNKNRVNDWFQEKVMELGQPMPFIFDENLGINFQQVREQKPDLIINVLGIMSKEDYSKLSRIAPVVAFNKGGENWLTSWDKATEIVGEALGREDDAAAIVKSVKGKLADVPKKHKELAGKSLAVTALDPAAETKIGLYSPKDTRSVVFSQMGFSEPKAIKDVKFPNGAFYEAYPADRAGKLKSDLLYTWVDSDSVAKKIKSDKQLGKIPAVAKGRMLADPKKSVANAMGTSPLAIEWLVDKSGFVQRLARVAEG